MNQYLFLLIQVNLSDVEKNDVVKKDVYNAHIKNIEDKLPDITNLDNNATINAKIKIQI